jgi:hypothetical protein
MNGSNGSEMAATFRRAVIGLVVTAAALSLWVAHPWVPVSNYDFDLYYFGGIVERTGSYTDTAAVLELADAAGKDVAEAGVYGSPTLVGLIFQPLSLLSLHTAHIVWPLMTVALLVIGVRRAVGDAWWPVWLSLALVSNSNLAAIGNGNFAIVTVALLLFTYGSIRQGKQKQAGIALALAIAFKLYPAFLLLPLLVKKQSGVLRWALSALTALLALTIPALGWNDSWSAIEQTLDVASFVHPWTENNGIPGALLHLTGNQELAKWVSRFAVLGSAVAVWMLRERVTTPSLFAVAAVLMTMSQSISWHLYFGIALLALLALRDLRPSRSTWFIMLSGYVLTNGIIGLDLHVLPRSDIGLPATFGLVVLCAALVAQVAQVTKPLADQNDASSVNAAK